MGTLLFPSQECYPFLSPPLSHDLVVRAVKLWCKGLAEIEGMGAIAWSWQSIEGAMVKALIALEIVGLNPTHRGKKQDKTERFRQKMWNPAPPSCEPGPGYDVKLLESALDRVVTKWPQGEKSPKQHLCTDEGYSCEPAWAVLKKRHYVPRAR